MTTLKLGEKSKLNRMRPKNHVSLNIYEVPKEIKKKKKDGCDNVVCLTS